MYTEDYIVEIYKSEINYYNSTNKKYDIEDLKYDIKETIYGWLNSGHLTGDFNTIYDNIIRNFK